MAESSNDKLFRTKVLPIMDKVMQDLRHKQLEEIGEHTSSLSYIMAGAAGPDGGMAAQAASLDSLRYTGKWNSKHTEDYIQMVKTELKKNHITVTADIEKKMIDKMINDQIPKSSIEYIMKKAATNTIFYLPQALNKSPLEAHIDAQAEKRYNPSSLEKGTGYVLGAAADYLTMGGVGGSWSSAAKFVGVDLALNTAMDKVSESNSDDVPMVIDPKYREQYKADQQRQKKQNTTAAKPKVEDKPKQDPQSTISPEQEEREGESAQDTPQNAQQQEQSTDQQQPEQTNQSGWNGLLTSFGLNGLQDIGHNLGYVLAMLPDMLIGAFTGKSKSLGLKDNLMPLASIVAGMFVKNPIMKMVLIGMGGLNLLNKAGHEAIDNHIGVNQSAGQTGAIRANYKVYQDEELNARIAQPQIKGNCLIATIDRVPCTIALPDKVVDAYNQGALPLNTLANAVLAKNDQMRQMASDNYAANEQQIQTRTLAQR